MLPGTILRACGSHDLPPSPPTPRYSLKGPRLASPETHLTKSYFAACKRSVLGPSKPLKLLCWSPCMISGSPDLPSVITTCFPSSSFSLPPVDTVSVSPCCTNPGDGILFIREPSYASTLSLINNNSNNSTVSPPPPVRGVEDSVGLSGEVFQSPGWVLDAGGNFPRVLVHGTEPQSLETVS